MDSYVLLITSLLFVTRNLRFILYISCPRLGIGYFFRKPWFLQARNGFQKSQSGYQGYYLVLVSLLLLDIFSAQTQEMIVFCLFLKKRNKQRTFTDIFNFHKNYRDLKIYIFYLFTFGCVGLFSRCSEWGLLSSCSARFLLVVASLVALLWSLGFRSCGLWTQQFQLPSSSPQA